MNTKLHPFAAAGGPPAAEASAATEVLIGPWRAVARSGRRPWTARLAPVAATLLLATAVGGLVWRARPLLNIPGRPDGVHVWMGDFRDAIYYPVVALLHGINPYDAAALGAAYPVHNAFPLYSPLTLVVHAPFGLLPFGAAEVAYAALTLALLLATVHLAVRLIGLEPSWARTAIAAAVVLLSRPGYLNALLGQCTLQVVLGTYLALYAARVGPWWAAAGLALAAIKPTYGGPLAVLLLARGDTAVVARGALLAGVPTLLATAVVAGHAGGFGALASTLPANYAVTLHDDPIANAVTSAIRIDLAAFAARLSGREPGAAAELAIAVSVLGLAAAALRRMARAAQDAATRALAATVACLAMLLCTYHQNYDLLLLILPALAVGCGRWPSFGRPVRLRIALLVLLLAPFANHLLGGRTLRALQAHPALLLGVTSFNAAALLLAFGIALWWAWQIPAAGARTR